MFWHFLPDTSTDIGVPQCNIGSRSRIWAFVVLSPYARLNTADCGSVAKNPFGNRTRGLEGGFNRGFWRWGLKGVL